ncbi:hypothetical protein PENSPDRAFT_689845 [Peniophora sp. CONT]|nr:hypothetical protein PENSPDRAFT_689845 [Peniophora sp. CONT]
MPIFFRRSGGGVGMRVVVDADYDTIPEAPTRISAKSLKATLSLHNYPTDERQIQLRCRANATVSARHLARLVATKVRNFIEKADQENATMVQWKAPRWKFGAGVDCIKINDVIRLGVVFVSPEKVTPLLKLRSDYPFNL